MSMSKYFKNYILFGDVECYCLVCKETFQTHGPVEKHIRWDKHRSNVKSQTYLPQFKKDFVSKLDNYYYCEICNHCTKYYKAIANHIRSETHKSNKANPDTVYKKCIGKHERGHIVIEDTVITKTQWNGINREKCVVCCTNVRDIAEHVRSQDHIINLIQTETKCAKGQYYRQINGHFFQCFSCKNMFPNDIMDEHWNSESHIENTNSSNMLLCQEAKQASEMESLVSEARSVLLETQRDYFKLDPVNETSTCKTCKETFSLDLKEMLMHLKQQHSDLIIKEILQDAEMQLCQKLRIDSVYADRGRLRSELALYGKDHFVKLNEGGKRAYCWICDVVLIPQINVLREHIKGVYHKSHLQLAYTSLCDEQEIDYKMTTLNRYIKNLSYSIDLSSFVINNDYCVDNLSFFFLLKISYNPIKTLIKCHACNTVFSPKGMFNHCKAQKHAEYVMSSRVLDMRNEFIREIQPRQYHCGLCNQVFSLSVALEKHLKSYKHIQKKTDRSASMCFNFCRRTKGWLPSVDQLSLDGSTEMMYLSYMKYAITSTYYKLVN